MSSCPYCGASVGSDPSVCPSCGSTPTETDPELASDQYRPKLLIEWIAERTRITRLTDALSGEIYAPYLLVGVLIFIDYGVIQTYNYFVTGKTSWLSNPSGLILALGLVVAVIGVRYMANQYASAVASLELSDRPSQLDVTQFETLVSFRTKLGVYALGLAIYYFNLFLGPGVQTLIEADGIIKFAVGQFVLAPLINLVLVVEFAVLFYPSSFFFLAGLH